MVEGVKIALFAIAWVFSGAVSFWFVETRIRKKDIRTDDLLIMGLIGLLGGVGVLCAIGVAVITLLEKHCKDKIIFKAKRD